MTIYKEIILSAVLFIVLRSVKVVYGLPTTLEEAQNEEKQLQTDRSDMINYTISNQPDIEFPNRSGIC
jgi:hypothetical protein